MTSATDNKTQIMSQWMSEVNNSIFTDEHDQFCVNQTKDKFDADEDLLNLAEAIVTFEASYSECMKLYDRFRGQMSKLYKEYKAAHNITNVYCFKMALNHTGFVKIINGSRMANLMTKKYNIHPLKPTTVQLDSIQIGSKCNETDEKDLNNRIYTIKCKVPNKPYSQWTHLQEIGVNLNIFYEYVDKLINEFKCERGSALGTLGSKNLY
ncbi:hypothetical protein ACKWTF_014832 [Chironomus riparius]